ncbi:hypothetical protein FSP39_012368 [Pinctada imbricata]|uniref:Transmembrane protein 135 N-terminal domain-containing protein n=1 Tax=Pinctada imbricata TaxID=66713 RepID=A0AA89C778_PINIB|nr:hypothetical protein FSP39_012368 [Pinctada imbricata]
MAVFGKPKTLTCTCYELGHTWSPSCTYASIDVAQEVFRQAAKIYGTLYVVAGLVKRRDSKYFKKKLLLEILQSCLFLTTNGTLFISFFCLWRKITGFYFLPSTFICGIPACALSISLERGDRKLLGRFFFLTASFIPAALGSYVAILLERKSRRGLLAIYMANVATETFYRMALSRGWVTPVRHGEVLLFSIASAIYLYLFRKNSLPSQTSQLFRFLVGRDELPVSVLAEEGESTKRKHTSGAGLSQIATHPLVQKVNRSLQATPKHPLCQHRNGCLYYALKGFTKLFGIGFVIQGGVKLISSLPRIFKQPSSLLQALKHRDNFKLGAFLGCFSAIFRLVNCLLRWVRNKDDELHGMLAGFLAGWSMLWFKSTTIALYTAYKLAEILYFKGISKGIVPYIRYADIIIYSISTAYVFHIAVLEPHCLRPAYWKFLVKVTGDRFSKMNRKLLEPVRPDAAKMFPDFWPDYDMRYTSLARESYFGNR